MSYPPLGDTVPQKNQEEALEWNDGYVHEALDRLHVVQSIIDEFLIDHPAVYRAGAKEILQGAALALQEVYEKVGALRVDMMKQVRAALGATLRTLNDDIVNFVVNKVPIGAEVKSASYSSTEKEASVIVELENGDELTIIYRISEDSDV